MALSDTKSYVLTAASTSLADLMSAIIAHFTAAPGIWQLKAGVAPVAGEALVITEKTARRSDIAIRRVSTTHIAARIDPDLGISDAGSASAASTASSNASPEARSRTFSGIGTTIYVIEHTDAVTILFWNVAKTACPEGIHAGIVYDSQFAGEASLGLTGHGVLVGQPMLDATGASTWPWFSANSSSMTDGSRIRGWNSGGAATWGAPQRLGTFTSSSSGSNFSSASDDGVILATRAMPLICNDIGGVNDVIVGQTRYLRAAPFVATTLIGQFPRTRLQGLTDEGWLYAYATVNATPNVISWEFNVVPT